MSGSRLVAALAILLASSAPAVQVEAQSWPTKPVRIISPFAPGGPGDILLRPLADGLSKVFGQPVLIENRPGAGGTTGARDVARADPDGYMLLYGTNSPFAVGPVVYVKAGYTAASFAPISLVSQAPFVLSVSIRTGARSVADLVEAARRSPDGFSYGSVGLATTTHLLGEILNQKAGTRMAHVPYRGGGPAMNDLVGGQIQLFFEVISNVAPHHDAGKIRAVMVLDEQRNKALPDVPTAAEAGYPDMIARYWSGLAAPAGTPREIVERLSREVDALLAQPDVVALMARLGLSPVGGPPVRLAERIAEEAKVWRAAAERAGVRID